MRKPRRPDLTELQYPAWKVDTKKLDKNTYTSLIKQADDVKSQIMQSASDAKANLKALFNRLSGADAVKIDEDGFNLNDATPDDCVNIIERIKNRTCGTL